ncbi:MAG: DNA mismatch endonuclease Vsr [Clostridia bacterium]|nr:DNA mismatch endonuclease Vsr [Clostridia bacterium]
MDDMTVAQRSANMSHIRSTNSKPEEIVSKYLFAKGFRYRKNDKRYAGKPDLVFPKYKTMIFINGCFWHCHRGCKYAATPKTNTDYWLPKLARNVERDERNHKELLQAGWNIIIVWECALRKEYKDKSLETLVDKLLNPMASIQEISC